MNGPDDPPAPVDANPWRSLRRHTPARIGLGRAGSSLPTAAQLAFQLAHAQARDAVHRPLDVAALCAELPGLGLQALPLHSAASDRRTYLQRPDLGRQLASGSRTRLQAWAEAQTARPAPMPTSHAGAPSMPTPPACTLALVLADGLSSLAVQRHALPFLAALLPQLGPGWALAPVAVVEQARVAVGDEIGQLLGAQLVVMLIGERPGLSSPDSLGIYLTWAPCVGRRDAERNCISNVRPEGLPCSQAAARLALLLQAARQRQLTGVDLKDESPPFIADTLPPGAPQALTPPAAPSSALPDTAI